MHMAYRDAINKAYSIARSSGLKILFPILVEEQSGTYMPYVTRGANLTMAAEAAYVPTDITPGQQVMNLRLRVVFAAQALPR